jgi:hypothetical protein
MPITGTRSSEHCRSCVRDRTECGNCKYLAYDRRQQDRRHTDERDNYIDTCAAGVEGGTDDQGVSE